MKKIGFLFLFFACLKFALASEFHVELFEHDPFDLKNARSVVKDMNTDPCSVLRIETNVVPELYVTGQDVQRRDKTSPGEYYVFLSYRSAWVSFTAEGYLPFTYQIPLNMEPKKTYRVVLKGDGKQGYVADKDLFTVQFGIEPEDVYISRNEGAPIPARGNQVQFRVAKGMHRFTFSKSGYKDKTIELSVNENINQEIELEKGATATKLKLPGFAVIESTPAGAEMYLNEQLVGNTPIPGNLSPEIIPILLRCLCILPKPAVLP
jgi:hypothetical protein